MMNDQSPRKASVSYAPDARKPFDEHERRAVSSAIKAGKVERIPQRSIEELLARREPFPRGRRDWGYRGG